MRIYHVDFKNQEDLVNNFGRYDYQKGEGVLDLTFQGH